MSCTAKCLRFLLVVFNFIIFVAGGVMSGCGIYLLTKSNELGFKSAAYAIPIFITALGFVILIIGFLGCCGALKLNKCLLMMFVTVVGIIIIGEIAGGVLLITYRGKVKAALQDFFKQAILEVEKAKNPKLEDSLRTLQDKLKCCGAYGPDDWKEPKKRCCKRGETTCEEYPSKGCVEAVSDILRSNLIAVGATILILAFVEVGALVAAVCAVKSKDKI